MSVFFALKKCVNGGDWERGKDGGLWKWFRWGWREEARTEDNARFYGLVEVSTDTVK